MQRTAIATAIGLCIATGTVSAAQIAFGPAVTTDRANVTQLESNGAGYVNGVFPGGGMNNVNMNWDGTLFNSSNDYTGPGSVSNVTLSTTTPAFGHLWTAHEIQMFAPGSYVFDTTLGGGVDEQGPLNLVVGSNQIGMHLLLDWDGNLNMDIAMVFDFNRVFGSGIGFFENPSFCATPLSNCLYNTIGLVGNNPANRPAGNHVWMLASADGNGDGIPGIPMVPNNPFSGNNFNLNADFGPTNTVAGFTAFGQSLNGATSVSLRSAPLDYFSADNVASTILAVAVAGNFPLEVVRQGNNITRITLSNITPRGNVVSVVYNGLSVPNPTVSVQTIGGCVPYTLVGPTAGCAPPYGDGNGFSTSESGNVNKFARAATIALVGGRNITYAPFCWFGGCGEPRSVDITP